MAEPPRNGSRTARIVAPVRTQIPDASGVYDRSQVESVAAEGAGRSGYTRCPQRNDLQTSCEKSQGDDSRRELADRSASGSRRVAPRLNTAGSTVGATLKIIRAWNVYEGERTACAHSRGRPQAVQ